MGRIWTGSAFDCQSYPSGISFGLCLVSSHGGGWNGLWGIEEVTSGHKDQFRLDDAG